MVAEYTCPPARGPLRFGNHDRHANPEDCGTFYICLASGQFNKAACDKVGKAVEVTELVLFLLFQPRVFSEEAGACLEAKDVPGCEDYNKEEEE